MNHALPQAPDQLNWRKSSHSQGQNDCVEVANTPDGSRWLRDTKNRNHATHHLTAPAWTAFIKNIKNSEPA